MMTLPGKIAMGTARLVALLELAEWGARSEADRLLVTEIRNDVQQLAERYAAQKGGGDAGTISGFDRGAEGTESQGEGGGDGGGQGTEPTRAGGGVG